MDGISMVWHCQGDPKRMLLNLRVKNRRFWLQLDS